MVFEGERGLPLGRPGGPAPWPAVTPGRCSYPPRSRPGGGKGENGQLFASNLVIRSGPLPGGSGNVDFAPTRLLRGREPRSEGEASWERGETETAERNRPVRGAGAAKATDGSRGTGSDGCLSPGHARGRRLRAPQSPRRACDCARPADPESRARPQSPHPFFERETETTQKRNVQKTPRPRGASCAQAHEAPRLPSSYPAPGAGRSR